MPTDTDTTNDPTEPAAAIQINAQYIKDLSFENPRAPMSLQDQTQPSIDVNVDIKATRVAEKSYEVILDVTADANSENGQVFILELSYAGVFTLTGIPENNISGMLLVECPRLLFPFARAIVADATRDGGYPPLMIQPVDFARLFIESQQQNAETPPAS